jgi:hypothetical protein
VKSIDLTNKVYKIRVVKKPENYKKPGMPSVSVLARIIKRDIFFWFIYTILLFSLLGEVILAFYF